MKLWIYLGIFVVLTVIDVKADDENLLKYFRNPDAKINLKPRITTVRSWKIWTKFIYCNKD